MNLSPLVFVRLYQKQLKYAGIYFQIAQTNNLIDHCLKIIPILAGFVNIFALQKSHCCLEQLQHVCGDLKKAIYFTKIL